MPQLLGLNIEGIQSYIFDSNELTDVLGASTIVEAASGKELLKKCIESVGGSFDETGLLVYGTGNIRYICKDDNAPEIAKELLHEIRKIYVGLVCNVSYITFEDFDSDCLYKLDRQLAAKSNIIATPTQMLISGGKRYDNTGRIANLKCNAQSVGTSDEETHIDIVSYTKKQNRNKAKDLDSFERLKGAYPSKTFSKEFKGIAKYDNSYMAIVHADTNGLGQAIKNYIKTNPESSKLKELSNKLKGIVISAFETACIKNLINPQGDTLPIRPIILGGDDITLVIHSELALGFTEEYLAEFTSLSKAAFKDYNDDFSKGLRCCAGIVYTKEKYPFHFGVEIANQLCSNAKLTLKEKGIQANAIQIKKLINASYDEIFRLSEITYLTDHVHSDGDVPNLSTLKTILEEIQKSKSRAGEENQKSISLGHLREWRNHHYTQDVAGVAESHLMRMFELYPAAVNLISYPISQRQNPYIIWSKSSYPKIISNAMDIAAV